MSHEFIEFFFPCAECLVTAACRMKPDSVKVKDISPRQICLSLPHGHEMTHHKCAIECLINLLHRMICSMSKMEDPKTGRDTSNNIPMQYVLMMGRMIDLLQWMINSVSWDEGILQEFDKIEIKNKLSVMGVKFK